MMKCNSRCFPWWIVLGAILIPSAYLPSLSTRFDFIDDGNLVYPIGPLSLGEHWDYLRHRVAANVEHLGPFRPVLHAFWQVEAELFDGNPVAWRLGRLLWSMLAAGMLLWLLHELRLHPVAALLTTALAMWNPYRNEIWMSLTLSEGVAMPFALFALVCAARASSSRRSWYWDLVGAGAMLLALGCKNTFAALVPAQVLLRLLIPGIGLREAVKCHGRRAAFLLLPLLLPIGHFLYFHLNWHPGQYQVEPLSWLFAARLARALISAVNIDFMALGILLALYAVLREKPFTVFMAHRRTILAALALLISGFLLYLPIRAVSGRYTIPAVWGLDLLLAVLFHELVHVSTKVWRQSAFVAAGAGLVVVLVTCIGRQIQFAARIEILWQTLEVVERTTPSDSCVGWLSGQRLNVEEGIHFAWHLRGRGRADVQVRLLGENDPEPRRVELPTPSRRPDWLVTSSSNPPSEEWELASSFRTTYHLGLRQFECYLWQSARREAATARVSEADE